MGKKLTLTEVITKIKSIHGDYYLLDNIDYQGCDTPMSIICPIHGEFKKSLSNILKGQGCKKCNKYKRKTTEWFIKKAKVIHGDTYIYDHTKYIKSIIPTTITCKVHGDFQQRPNSHLNGSGCPECGNVRCKNALTKSQNDFIKDSIKQHGDKYDYSNAIYTGAFSNVLIKCNTCDNEFTQLPTHHIRGSGCPKCALSNEAFWRRSKFINKYKDQLCTHYIIRCWNDNEDFIKMGITGQSVERRFCGKAMPYDYKILHTTINQPGRIWDIEQKMKKTYKRFKYEPELEFGGRTECFTLELLKNLKRV